MLSNRPDAAELVDAVRLHLEGELLPTLEGAQAFHLRVAINALAIVVRECRDSAALASADAAGLAALLGRAEAAENERLLVEEIREGRLGPASPGLLEYLKARTLRRLAVDNPRYRHED